MKTIEERAYSRYADNNCPRDCEKCEMRTDCTDVDYVWAFIDGAQSEHEELTRWHDPNTPPDSNRYVLCGIGRNSYSALRYEKDKDDFIDCNGIAYVITGWREIHE